MQIRWGHHNRSWPDRRRLQAQVRSGVEMETETGGPAEAGVVAQAALGQTQAGWLGNAVSQVRVSTPMGCLLAHGGWGFLSWFQLHTGHLVSSNIPWNILCIGKGVMDYFHRHVMSLSKNVNETNSNIINFLEYSKLSALLFTKGDWYHTILREGEHLGTTAPLW